MIWPIVPILRRHALPLGILLALGTAYAWHRSETNAARRQGYEQAQSEGKAAIAELDRQTALREAEEREISRAHEVASLESRNALQARLDSLTRRNLDLGRLRQPAGRCPSPARDAEPASLADASPGERGHAVPVAEDSERQLGIELSQYGADCEALRLQVVSLQSWILATR